VSTLDDDTGLYSGIFVCTNTLGCMTEDPNTVSNTDDLVSWTVVESAANTFFESVIHWDELQACVEY